MGRTLIKSFHTTLSDLISCGGIDGSKKKKSKRSALTSEFFTQASVESRKQGSLAGVWGQSHTREA